MAKIRPFPALRPVPDLTSAIAAPPYDVVSTEEARTIVQQKPHSLLRITRAEIHFPSGTDPHGDAIYQKARQVFEQDQHDGFFRQDPSPCLYIYRQQWGQHVQTGLVAGTSCLEYDRGDIRKHELTRPDKEMDRVRHIETLEAQLGPVWLTYQAVADIDEHIHKLTQQEPAFQFTASDDIVHTGWVVNQPADVQTLQALFASQVPLLYVADGHHRSAAASHVAKDWREQHQVSPEHPSQYFLSVIFPHNQLNILSYNRYVHDLHGLQPHTLLQKLETLFVIQNIEQYRPPSPEQRHQFDMYLAGQWYRLTARPGILQEDDPIESLDVQILQKYVLDPLLGIQDPRRSQRISFVGGTRGHQELETLVQQGHGVAFVCYPTSIQELFRVANANQIMPPKSTWFAPKLRSGLFIYKF